MTKKEMQAKLLRYKGVGVKVITVTGFTSYFFYEDFENQDGTINCGIDRAYKHFSHNEHLIFYSNKWAKQVEFKDYLIHYKKLQQLAEAYPENPIIHNQLVSFEEFITERLMKFAGFSQRTAKRQILRNSISFNKFTEKVIAL